MINIMKSIIVFFTILLLFFTVLLVLYAFPREDDKSKSFLNEIETAFSTGAQGLSVSEVFSKPFDEICIFMTDSSMPEESKPWIESFIKERNLAGELKLKNNMLTFVTIQNNNFEIYGFRSPKIKVAKEYYWFSFKREIGERKVAWGHKCYDHNNAVFKLSKSERYNNFHITLSEE